MYHGLIIPNNHGINYYFGLDFYNYPTSKRIEVEDVCVIDIYKAHDHRYDLKAFFYEKNIRSKKELHSTIQKLLQENLNVAVQ